MRGGLHIVDWPPETLRTKEGSIYVFRGMTVVAGPFKSEPMAQAWIDLLDPKGHKQLPS